MCAGTGTPGGGGVGLINGLLNGPGIGDVVTMGNGSFSSISVRALFDSKNGSKPRSSSEVATLGLQLGSTLEIASVASISLFSPVNLSRSTEKGGGWLSIDRYSYDVIHMSGGGQRQDTR